MSLTPNKLVSDIRNISSSGSNPIEFRIEDSQILYWCNQLRSKLISQALQRKNDILDVWLQVISCLELEQVDKSECCEINTNCYILRTKKELPITIETPYDNSIVRVETPTGKLISKTSALEEKYNSYNKYTKEKSRWFIKNNRIYITNEDLLEYINVWGLFDDPMQLKEYVACDGNTCFDWNSVYPATMKMATDITDIVLKTKVFPFLQLPADNTNDANNTTPQPNTKNL
jgi:predicted transport protein